MKFMIPIVLIGVLVGCGDGVQLLPEEVVEHIVLEEEASPTSEPVIEEDPPVVVEEEEIVELEVLEEPVPDPVAEVVPVPEVVEEEEVEEVDVTPPVVVVVVPAAENKVVTLQPVDPMEYLDEETLPVPNYTPHAPSWTDSYSSGGKCYMATTFDHGVGAKIIDTPQGPKTVRQIHAAIGPGPGKGSNPVYNDVGCGHGPSNNFWDEDACPGRVDIGKAGCIIRGPRWDLSVFGSYNTYENYHGSIDQAKNLYLSILDEGNDIVQIATDPQGFYTAVIQQIRTLRPNLDTNRITFNRGGVLSNVP